MTDRKFAACARRAREAGGLSALATPLLLAALVCAGAGGAARAQEASRPSAAGGAATIVGAWHATLPTGLRIATLTVVPDGEGFGGAFVGYDYEGKVDFRKPLEGPPPRVSIRSGSLLTAAKLEGDTFTFKVYLRHPSPPHGKPAGREVSGEVRLTGGGTAELRLSAPHKPEPMVLKLTNFDDPPFWSEFRNHEERRAHDLAELRRRGGGALGLESVREVVAGVKDFPSARELWGRLYAPAAERAEGVWEVDDGPALRLVPAAADSIQALTLKVSSLPRAETFLRESGMLGVVTDNEISIAPSKLEGLDVRLVA